MHAVRRCDVARCRVGSTITIETSGADEKEAIDALTDLILPWIRGVILNGGTSPDGRSLAPGILL